MSACAPGKNLQCYEFPSKKLPILVYFLLKLTDYLRWWNGLFANTDFHLQTLNTLTLHILGQSITIVLRISRTSHKFYCFE